MNGTDLRQLCASFGPARASDLVSRTRASRTAARARVPFHRCARHHQHARSAGTARHLRTIHAPASEAARPRTRCLKRPRRAPYLGVCLCRSRVLTASAAGAAGAAGSARWGARREFTGSTVASEQRRESLARLHRQRAISASRCARMQMRPAGQQASRGTSGGPGGRRGYVGQSPRLPSAQPLCPASPASL